MSQGPDTQSVQVVLVVTPDGSQEHTRLLTPDEYSKYLTPSKTILADLNSSNSNLNKDKLYFTEIRKLDSTKIIEQLKPTHKISINYLEGKISKMDITNIYDLYPVHLIFNGDTVMTSKIINGRNVFDFTNLANQSFKLEIIKELSSGSRNNKFVNFSYIDSVQMSSANKKSASINGKILYESPDSNEVFEFKCNIPNSIKLGFDLCVDIIEIYFKELTEDLELEIKLDGRERWGGNILAGTEKLILKLKDPEETYRGILNDMNPNIKNETINLSRVSDIELVFKTDIDISGKIEKIEARNYNAFRLYDSVKLIDSGQFTIERQNMFRL